MWYDVLHTPSTHSREAWKWARLVISGYSEQKDDLLVRSRKAAVVPVISISDGSKRMVESVLALGAEGHLEELVLHGIPTTTDVALLSQTVSKLFSFKIAGVQSRQLEAILGALIEGPDISLRTLHLHEEPQVSGDILARAALKLNTLVLEAPTSAQIGEILTMLASSEDSKLRVLDLPHYGDPRDISYLSPETVAEALVKLEIANIFEEAILSPGQMNSLMTKIKDTEDLRLTKLDLWNAEHADISQVAPDVLAGAVSRLESVDINVTPPQTQSIFSRLQLGGSKLKCLTLYGEVDLSAVTTEVLLRVLRMLESVELVGPAFTTAQVAAIITMLSEESHGKLKKLHIIDPDDSEEEAYELLVDIKANDMANDILEIEL